MILDCNITRSYCTSIQYFIKVILIYRERSNVPCLHTYLKIPNQAMLPEHELYITSERVLPELIRLLYTFYNIYDHYQVQTLIKTLKYMGYFHRYYELMIHRYTL